MVFNTGDNNANKNTALFNIHIDSVQNAMPKIYT